MSSIDKNGLSMLTKLARQGRVTIERQTFTEDPNDVIWSVEVLEPNGRRNSMITGVDERQRALASIDLEERALEYLFTCLLEKR